MANALARLQGLNFFNDTDGQSYTFAEIASWLTTVGFSSLRRIRLRRTPGFGMVIGTKEAG